MEKITEVDGEDSAEIVAFAPYDVDGRVQVDSHRLGMAIAHVSAQAGTLADAQLQLQYRQSQQLFQQQQYVEHRVEHVRAEVNARNEELAHYIRQTQVDPAQIDSHINIRIQAAMEEARREAIGHAQVASQQQVASLQVMEVRLKAAEESARQSRASVEQQAQAQQDMEKRLSAAFSAIKAEASADAEQRTKELLGAYFKHHAAQTKTAIAAEAAETSKQTAAQLRALEHKLETRLENSAKLVEKKARAAVRRHLASENIGLEEFKQSLLQSISEGEERAVARAEAQAKKMLNELVTRQLADAAMLDISASGVVASMISPAPEVVQVSERVGHASTASSHDQEESTADDNNYSTDEEMNSAMEEMSFGGENIGVVEGEPASLMRLDRAYNQAAHIARQDVIAIEQGKVTARALKRSMVLKLQNQQKRATARSSGAKSSLTNCECVELALKLSEKRKAAHQRKSMQSK